jgi:hypothetical protein
MSLHYPALNKDSIVSFEENELLSYFYYLKNYCHSNLKSTETCKITSITPSQIEGIISNIEISIVFDHLNKDKYYWQCILTPCFTKGSGYIDLTTFIQDQFHTMQLKGNSGYYETGLAIDFYSHQIKLYQTKLDISQSIIPTTSLFSESERIFVENFNDFLSSVSPVLAFLYHDKLFQLRINLPYTGITNHSLYKSPKSSFQPNSELPQTLNVLIRVQQLLLIPLIIIRKVFPVIGSVIIHQKHCKRYSKKRARYPAHLRGF